MDGPLPPCTALVLLATAITSFVAFGNPSLERRLIFHPESILAEKQYYRLLTPAFLHAGWGHLLMNLIGLYSFGGLVELYCGKAEFLWIYFGSVLGGNLLSLLIHRFHDYCAYGASGGVCGILFAYLLLFPGGGVQLYFALPVPGWLFALGFLLGSYFALKQGRDNIGHDAHLGGALAGLLITAAKSGAGIRLWQVPAPRRLQETGVGSDYLTLGPLRR